MTADVIAIFQPSIDNEPVLKAARVLYESTLDPDERIPWEWIERSLGKPAGANGWVKHLLVASAGGVVLGYGYGAYIPGYGGYICYLGVAEAARGRGIVGQLFDALFAAFRADAASLGESLPFVVWESYRGEPGEPSATIWPSRVRAFGKAGGQWVAGVELMSPNFADPAGEPIPLQLFVRPEAVHSFDARELRKLVGGLLERVYREAPGDDLYERTLPPGCKPRLVDERRGLSPPEVLEPKTLRRGQAPPLVAAS